MTQDRAAAVAMPSAKIVAFRIVAALCAGATLFFGYFGALLVYTAMTIQGEGSLGHVGMVIGAIAFPLLALVCAALTWLAWRTAQRAASAQRAVEVKS